MERLTPSSSASSARARRSPIEPPAPRATRSGHRDSATLPILIIDDDSVFTRTMAKALAIEGYAVSHTMYGRQGIERAATEAFRALVVDQCLPDVPGEEVLARVRSVDQQVPIVVVTGVYLDEEHERRARALGISAYLHKPVWTDDLLRVLSKALASTATTGGDEPLHDGGCPPGTNDVLAAIWPDLCRRLQEAWSGLSPQAIVDGLDDAVLERLRTEDFRAVDRENLTRTLYWSAWRNIRNWVESEQRRRIREERYGREAAGRAAAEPSETYNVAARRVKALTLARTPQERHALTVWLDGGGWRDVAMALDCSECPEAQQRDVVKRFKDRILKRAAKLRR